MTAEMQHPDLNLVSKTVVCWSCEGQGTLAVYYHVKVIDPSHPDGHYFQSELQAITGPCKTCNATGLVTIRAPFDKVPVIDRTEARGG